jgi:hypothetical protein
VWHRKTPFACSNANITPPHQLSIAETSSTYLTPACYYGKKAIQLVGQKSCVSIQGEGTNPAKIIAMGRGGDVYRQIASL